MSLAQLPFLPPAEQQAILEGPALPPPPGKVSSFQDPPNNNGLALAVSILGLSVSSILLLVRVYTKTIVLRAPQVQDGYRNWFASICSLCSIHVLCFPPNATHRLLRPSVGPTSENHIRVPIYILLIGSNFYAVNILCIKVAILLDWLHMFVPGKTKNKFFWAC
ncbi:hypothetical protein F5Y14DRAFT_207443 [Nemania sp. NC0429]|nr:hypothetical protein F5Y14DRAFT_207443 [Nemania sp. NC0429]